MDAKDVWQSPEVELQQSTTCFEMQPPPSGLIVTRVISFKSCQFWLQSSVKFVPFVRGPYLRTAAPLCTLLTTGRFRTSLCGGDWQMDHAAHSPSLYNVVLFVTAMSQCGFCWPALHTDRNRPFFWPFPFRWLTNSKTSYKSGWSKFATQNASTVTFPPGTSHNLLTDPGNSGQDQRKGGGRSLINIQQSVFVTKIRCLVPRGWI